MDKEQKDNRLSETAQNRSNNYDPTPSPPEQSEPQSAANPDLIFAQSTRAENTVPEAYQPTSPANQSQYHLHQTDPPTLSPDYTGRHGIASSPGYDSIQTPPSGLEYGPNGFLDFDHLLGTQSPFQATQPQPRSSSAALGFTLTDSTYQQVLRRKPSAPEDFHGWQNAMISRGMSEGVNINNIAMEVRMTEDEVRSRYNTIGGLFLRVFKHPNEAQSVQAAQIIENSLFGTNNAPSSHGYVGQADSPASSTLPVNSPTISYDELLRRNRFEPPPPGKLRTGALTREENACVKQGLHEGKTASTIANNLMRKESTVEEKLKELRQQGSISTRSPEWSVEENKLLEYGVSQGWTDRQLANEIFAQHQRTRKLEAIKTQRKKLGLPWNLADTQILIDLSAQGKNVDEVQQILSTKKLPAIKWKISELARDSLI